MYRLPLLLLALAACAPEPEMQSLVTQLRVALTDAEAEAVLSLANTASEDALLDAVGLDSDEVEAIVAGRPFASIDLLEGAEDVDGFTLTALLAYAMDTGLYDPNTPTCDQGTIQLSDGRVFNSLRRASEEFQPGEVVTLCDGDFEHPVLWLQDITLRGVGDVTIRTSVVNADGATRFENLTLMANVITADTTANIRPDLVAQDVVFGVRQLSVRQGTLTLRNSRIESTVAVDVENPNLVFGLIVSEGAHAALFDSTVENFPAAFSAVTIEATSSFEMVGGGILGNMQGVTFRGDEARFDGVDFGLGPADNDLFDIRVERGARWTSYLELHDNVNGTCAGYSCSFEGIEAP